MQFYKDIQGKYSDIFLKLQTILLSFEEITEVKNAKQTSYSDEYSIVAMMRNRGDKFVVSLGKGVALQTGILFYKAMARLSGISISKQLQI